MVETCSQGREVVYLLCSLITVSIQTVYFSCLVTEQVERAFHLALAALLGETVYNFGELVRSYLLWWLQWNPSISTCFQVHLLHHCTLIPEVSHADTCRHMQMHTDDSICTQTDTYAFSRNQKNTMRTLFSVWVDTTSRCPDVRHLLITLGCFLVAGYLEMKLKKKTGYLYSVHILRKLAFVRFPTDFRKPITKTAYQTFPVVSDCHSIKEHVAVIWGEPERAPH